MKVVKENSFTSEVTIVIPEKKTRAQINVNRCREVSAEQPITALVMIYPSNQH